MGRSPLFLVLAALATTLILLVATAVNADSGDSGNQPQKPENPPKKDPEQPENPPKKDPEDPKKPPKKDPKQPKTPPTDTPPTRTPPTGTPPTEAPPTGSPPTGTPPTGTPPVGPPPTETPPSGTPPTGTPPIGTPPSGAPPTETPPSGTPPTGTPTTETPPSGTPPTGTPPIGTPPTETPLSGAPPTRTPPTGTPPTVTPPSGAPPTETPPIGPPSTGTPPTAAPPTVTPPTPEPEQPGTPKKVKCNGSDGKFPFCRSAQFTCPDSCPRSCFMDCELCRPVCYCNKPGGVCQDPRFVGGDGITFYFHGQKDHDFCLLSDFDLHINAHFIGKRGSTMTRDFTWVQSIVVLFGDHRIFIGAQKTAAWDDTIDRLSISFDGEPTVLPTNEGAKWESVIVPGLSIIRSSGTNAITMTVEGKFKITANVVPITQEESRVHKYGIKADDCFAHLELGFTFYSLTNEVNGVLGQTYREDYVSRVKLSANMPIMGGEHKFISSNIYATDCKVARFMNGEGGLALLNSFEKAVF